MFVLNMPLECVCSCCGEMTLITWDPVAARLVPVQIVLPQLLGKHRGVLTVLTLMLNRSAVNILNMLLKRRLVVRLERTFVADIALVGMKTVL